MAIKLTEEKSKRTGRTWLLQEVNYRGYRQRKALHLSYKTNPATFEEREEKKTNIALAKQLIARYEKEFIRNSYDLPQEYRTTEDFIAYARTYIE